MGGVFSKSTNRKVGTYLHNDENHQQSKAPDANVLIISGQKMDENSICGRDDNLDDHEVDLSTAISYSRHLRRDSETNSSILVLHDENADSNNMFLAEENVSLLPEITSDDIITSSNDSSVREVANDQHISTPQNSSLHLFFVETVV